MTCWRDWQHLPPSGGQSSGSVIAAIWMTDKYRGRTPTAKQLMADFDMSQATAYRWVRAFKDARGES